MSLILYSACVLALNPLTTEFFPPRRHIFMHTTFVGTSLPQHSLLSGQTWWGSHTWRDPFGNIVNDIHDPHKSSNGRSKVDVSWIFAQHFPKLRRHAVQPGSLMVGSEGEVETVDGTLSEYARGGCSLMSMAGGGYNAVLVELMFFCRSEKHTTWPHSNS